jgi:hypothetical protein
LDSNKIIENFVDKYITCDSDKLTPNFNEAQQHYHKKTCRKKNQTICHFNFQWLPMEETQIIQPICLKMYPLWKKSI